MPPTNFTGLSEETIRAMEETELTHVHARIQCLRNVRTLLDASIMQMEQYMNVILTQRFFYRNEFVKNVHLNFLVIRIIKMILATNN